uniref:RTC domain-containing protein n=1 Tax=Heterorhabditis bacteriophora TaxID=37862 RepID=A0A1I7XTT7_HETBA
MQSAVTLSEGAGKSKKGDKSLVKIQTKRSMLEDDPCLDAKQIEDATAIEFSPRYAHLNKPWMRSDPRPKVYSSNGLRYQWTWAKSLAVRGLNPVTTVRNSEYGEKENEPKNKGKNKWGVKGKIQIDDLLRFFDSHNCSFLAVGQAVWQSVLRIKPVRISGEVSCSLEKLYSACLLKFGTSACGLYPLDNGGWAAYRLEIGDARANSSIDELRAEPLSLFSWGHTLGQHPHNWTYTVSTMAIYDNQAGQIVISTSYVLRDSVHQILDCKSSLTIFLKKKTIKSNGTRTWCPMEKWNRISHRRHGSGILNGSTVHRRPILSKTEDVKELPRDFPTAGGALPDENLEFKSQELPTGADCEMKLISLLERITNGTRVEISGTGTKVHFRPGLITGGVMTIECGEERCLSYFLEPLIMISPFCKNPMTIKLKETDITRCLCAIVPRFLIMLLLLIALSKQAFTLIGIHQKMGLFQIERYFLQHSTKEGEFQATFRGRGLQGKLLCLPEGYELNVVKAKGCNGTFTIESNSKGYMHWEWDREVGGRSSVVRALAHLEVAASLAND